LIDVYKKSGVTKPIFVLPLPLMLQDFLNLKQQKTPHTPFVFGMVGGFWARKNHMRVLEAFTAEFGNRTDVKLKLHGRFGEPNIIKALEDKIKADNLTNVELIVGPYNWTDYVNFYNSIDCYVLLSMGEGFSITPREALACGKPCILTKNTAQITLCAVPGVRAVRSDILVPAIYDCHYENYGFNYDQQFIEESNVNLSNTPSVDDEISWRSAPIGYQFDCKVIDARRAMRDVYKNYPKYLKKAQKGREWVTRYLPENLLNKYLSLIKPQSVVLGAENIVGDTFLMTTSTELYEKYQSIIGH
jgi:glycosyltransferase involved in cell wall biosynthesis